MNRPPGKGDSWWKRHEQECGGIYTKIAEPALTKEQVKKLSAKERAGMQKNKIDSWLKRPVENEASKASSENGVSKMDEPPKD